MNPYHFLTLLATVFVSHYAEKNPSLEKFAMSDRNKPGNLYRRANTITAGKIKKREGGVDKKTQINRVYLVRASNAKQRTSRSADVGVISPGHLHNSKSSKKGLTAISLFFFSFPSLLSFLASCSPPSFHQYHTRTLNHCPANKVF